MGDNIIVNVQQRSRDSIISFNIRHDYNLELQRSEILRIINVQFNILKTALYGQGTNLTPIPASDAGTTITVQPARRTSNEEDIRYRNIIQQQARLSSMDVQFIESPNKTKQTRKEEWTLKE
jgi:hypothetical protein